MIIRTSLKPFVLPVEGNANIRVTTGDLHCKRQCKSSKGKAVPLQAWTGPEGSRKLRFPDFVATAQDGGKVVSLTHRPPLPPINAPGTYFC